jgi:hypothetical protein
MYLYVYLRVFIYLDKEGVTIADMHRLDICIFKYMCLHMCIYVYTYECGYVCIHVCIHMYIYISIVYVFECMFYIYMCV